MIFLFLSEFYSFITPEIVSELFVDMAGSTKDKVRTNLNLTLPRLKCDYVGLDIQDEMGRHEVGFQENTQKWEINGGEGCKFEGKFDINKVPGNFHVSTHGAGEQPDDYLFKCMVVTTHGECGPTIEELDVVLVAQFPPGTPVSSCSNTGLIGVGPYWTPEDNSLDLQNIDAAFMSLNELSKEESNSISSHDYVLRVVPTIYEKLDGTKLYSFQYTWAYKDYISYGHGGRVMPAIWFRYDLSPITVKYVERRKPFYHFITTVFAIVGGTFTVAGIIDSLVFTASELFKKFQLGKLS